MTLKIEHFFIKAEVFRWHSSSCIFKRKSTYYGIANKTVSTGNTVLHVITVFRICIHGLNSFELTHHVACEYIQDTKSSLWPGGHRVMMTLGSSLDLTFCFVTDFCESTLNLNCRTHADREVHLDSAVSSGLRTVCLMPATLPARGMQKLSQIAPNSTGSGTVLHSPSFKIGVTALPCIAEISRKLKTLKHFEIWSEVL